jgi:hypothetical protein
VMTFAGNPNSNLPCTIKCGLHGMGNILMEPRQSLAS